MTERAESVARALGSLSNFGNVMAAVDSLRSVSVAEAVGAQKTGVTPSLRSTRAISTRVVLLPVPARPRKPVNWSVFHQRGHHSIRGVSPGYCQVSQGALDLREIRQRVSPA